MIPTPAAKNKGTHRAVKKLYCFIRKVSKNYTRPCFALQLDIKKFFESVDHKILLEIIKKKTQDKNLLWLIENILSSFSPEKGIPIGNLTSQLFANIYLSELDQFMKHTLKAKYYLRYADDFVILSENKDFLEKQIPLLNKFLEAKLKLSLHEEKIRIRKYSQGIDFLGYICLPHHVLPRTKTKRRIFKRMEDKIKDFNNEKISEVSLNQAIQSCLGFFSHADSYRLTQTLKNQVWFWANG